MLKNKNFIYIIFSGFILFLFTGCSLNQTINPVSMEQKLKNDDMNIFNEDEIKKYNKFSINIKPGDTIKGIIKKYNKENPFNNLVIDRIKKDVILKYNYSFKSLPSFIDYVKATLQKSFILQRHNGKIYSITEAEDEESVFDENYLIDTTVLKFVDQPIQWKGLMNEKEILNTIEENFNIPIIYKKNVKNYIDNNIKGSETEEYSDSNSTKKIVNNNSETSSTNNKNKNNEKTEENLDLSKKYIENYSGTIKKLLQRIAIENKLFLKYQKGIVILSEYDTKTFNLKIPYLDLKTVDLFKDITSLNLKPYEDLEKELRTILSSKAKLNINKSTGNVLIRANYDDLREAQIIIKNFHDMYKKTIDLDVYVYEVVLSKDNAFGVSFDNQFVNNYMNGTGVGKVTLNLGSLSTTTNSDLSTLSYVTSGSSTDSKFSKFFLNFLNNYGNAKILTKPKLQTINGIPVSMKVMNKQDYVASIDESSNTDTNSNTTSSSTSTNVDKETIETGFQLGIYPIAEKNGKIKLIIKPVISQLLNTDDFTYGTKDNPKTIQLLNVSEKDFSQTININDGEVAIISGYVYEKNYSTKDALPFIDATTDNVLDPLLATKEKVITRNELIIAIKAKIR